MRRDTAQKTRSYCTAWSAWTQSRYAVCSKLPCALFWTTLCLSVLWSISQLQNNDIIVFVQTNNTNLQLTAPSGVRVKRFPFPSKTADTLVDAKFVVGFLTSHLQCYLFSACVYVSVISLPFALSLMPMCDFFHACFAPIGSLPSYICQCTPCICCLSPYGSLKTCERKKVRIMIRVVSWRLVLVCFNH